MDKYSYRQVVANGDKPWKVYKATLSKWDPIDDAATFGTSENFFDFCIAAPSSTKLESADPKEIKSGGESEILID